VENPSGQVYLVESWGVEADETSPRYRDDLLKLLDDPGLLGGVFPSFRRDAIRHDACCFFDIETTGLSGGCYLFLAGFMTLEEKGLRIEQLLARDYDEEPALLEEAGRRLEARPSVLCYNGASFDLPFLRTRRAVHRLQPLGDLQVLDLLPPTRRLLRDQLENCRLATVEEHLRGRSRQDVPSALVPDLYHHFVREGDGRVLQGVLHHNRLDLLAMAVLLLKLAGLGGR